jgi:hypothetical protein
MAKHNLYGLQYRKKLSGNLKKIWRKKIFSLKSMTKLEDLTVVRLRKVVEESIWVVESSRRGLQKIAEEKYLGCWKLAKDIISTQGCGKYQKNVNGLWEVEEDKMSN